MSSSTASTQNPVLSASNSATSKPTAPSKSDLLAPGTVAGIVIAVGIFLAFLAALVTFLAMRRQNTLSSRRDFRKAKQHEVGGWNSRKGREKLPLAVIDDYLPQPADDKTVQMETKTVFDQVELFVENFCQVRPSPETAVATGQLSTFGSPHLPQPLASLLPRARDASFLIKHALAYYITCRISPAAATEDALLPADLALVSGAQKANAGKPGQSSFRSLLHLKLRIQTRLREVSVSLACRDGLHPARSFPRRIVYCRPGP